MLGAQPSIIGPVLLRVLLGDLFKRNDRIPLTEMHGSTPPRTLKGSVTIETFAEELATKDAFPAPHTFKRARQLVANAGHDVTQCLVAGFLELKLRYFPDIKFWDARKIKRVYWNFRDYIELHVSSQEASPQARGAAMTGDICIEIERRSLTYTRNLERYREHGMPWLGNVMSRLPPQMGKATIFKVLTFASCVGMIQNGDFISFKELGNLIRDMGVPQSELQKLQVQSRFLLPKVVNLSVWRLHDSIPYRMAPQPKGCGPKIQAKVEEEVREQPFEDVQALDADDVPHTVACTRSRCLPVTTKRYWSSIELSLVNVDPKVKLADAYKQYVEACIQNHITARNQKAFHLRRYKMVQ